MKAMIAGKRARHFDGTGERVAMLPRMYDGSRHPHYGGEPERRELSGTCVAIHAAREYSAAHPRTRCTVYVQGRIRTYLRGEVTQ